jgi:hypothetical protein
MVQATGGTVGPIYVFIFKSLKLKECTCSLNQILFIFFLHTVFFDILFATIFNWCQATAGLEPSISECIVECSTTVLLPLVKIGTN